MPHVFERQIAGRTMRMETGKLAGQANGAVVVTYGETILLVTAVASRKPREGLDFFPLTIDYEERLYAKGKIPGSFFKREGRPTADAILTMRLTDRPMRPLFPKGMRNDVQVIITTLSVDQENAPDIMAIVGASAALTISDIPFNGPVGACRIGFIDGRLVANPLMKQMENSQLDLVVAGTSDAIVMVEAGAKEANEEMVLQGMKMAQIINGEIVDLIEEMRRTVGKEKFTPVIAGSAQPDLESAVREQVSAGVEGVLFHKGLKADREAGMDGLKADAIAKLADKYSAEQVAGVFDSVLKKLVRARLLATGIRPDGRTLTEIRPITCEVGLLPRAHGSGLFTRGETQVLTITTLGSPGERQRLDGLGVEEFKRYMHHYNFPPYSVGEVKRMGGAGRREIGHGALAERALMAVIPNEETFPYTLRVVSEVVSSNGSTSMASVCASTLALMDAGVPIKSPVAGVAMGLIMGEGDSNAVLTDIQGQEDFLGDMDFKVAGTADGITALQMDMKIMGIKFSVLTQAIAQAKDGRMFILDKMKETIAAARPEMSKYAPRMTRIQINTEKIGAVIGPGGKMIRSIIEQTGASVDIEDDGTVYIGASSKDAVKRAIGIITGLTKEVQVGEIYTGKVVRIMNFGAFVEILPGKDGLVHVSELSAERVNRVEDVVNIGDEITVMVTEIDRMGRVNLSRRAVQEGLGQSGARGGDEAGQEPAGGEQSRSRPPFERSGGDRGGPPRRDGPPRGGDGGRPPFRGGGPPR